MRVLEYFLAKRKGVLAHFDSLAVKRGFDEFFVTYERGHLAISLAQHAAIVDISGPTYHKLIVHDHELGVDVNDLLH